MRRRFTQADQARFAAVSGDRNPIHVDPVRARRTIAGAPVVHGIHLLLWALDAVADAGGLPPVAQLRVQLGRFVHLDEEVTCAIVRRTDDAVQLRLSAGGSPRCDIAVGFGAAGPSRPIDADEILDLSGEPLDLPVEAFAGRRGRVRFAAAPETIAAMFPAAAAWLGMRRVAALAASTRLVGMGYPGLHSIYAGLRVTTCDDDGADDIGFAMNQPRHGLIAATIAGAGIHGTLECVARTPPVLQPRMAELAGTVTPGAFAGTTALVIGGSRGLGELAAKLLATGGARTIVSYRLGRDEAEAVVADIRGAGGESTALHYDVGEPAAEQLAALPEAPTHACYFAAPPIARPTSRFFDAARLHDLNRVFVDGFWDLAAALRARRADVRLFYPSTVYVTERPRGLAEYAMAKAAGEVLCAEINATLAPTRVTVGRLPRLATDQTAGTAPEGIAPAVDTLLPWLRAMQDEAAVR